MQQIKAQRAHVSMEVVVRDKHGNVKYAGPLVMDVVSGEPEDIKEPTDGRNAPDRS